MQRFRSALVFLVLALLVGCGHPQEQGADTDAGAMPEACIALQKDIAQFETWPRYLVGTGAAPAPHPGGTRYAYVNKLPPHGSTVFPDCTIIVKQTVPDDGGTPLALMYAMSKRGGGFNAQGAVGWEWMELGRDTHGQTVIVWRGEYPPDGEGYQMAGSTGDCNACHASAKDNDYVQGTGLQLSSF